MDIDFDTQATRRSNILLAMKEFFGNDNILNIATFGTEGSKSACLTACRGYRSDEYPNGIDTDKAKYLSSFIPTTRGETWSVEDVVYGNREKDRQPVRAFVAEVEQYEGLLEIILRIEGLVNKRSSHASGVYIYNHGYLRNNALMKAPSGLETTQFDMDDSDYMGSLKYDFLTIKSLDKIRVMIDLLIADGVVKKEETLKETYDKLIHPDILPYDNTEIWDMAAGNNVIDLFQMDTGVGALAVKQINPHSLIEFAHANSLMRLMGERGQETPLDKYARFKSNINLWYEEMAEYELNSKEINIIEKHLLVYYGIAATQEDMMTILMDKSISNFDLKEANMARKAVAKKKADVLEKVKQLFFEKCQENGTRTVFANYIWNKVVMPQAGYSFSKNHTIPYSIIAFQELYLNYISHPIYWSTACLTVNSGSAEEYVDEDFIDDEESSKNKAVDYGKTATAINRVLSAGIDVFPPDVNLAELDFRPDIKNNRIIFGLRGVIGVGDSDIERIVSEKPYTSMMNFVEKTSPRKAAVISLIKSGAFDEIEPDRSREEVMKEYIESISEVKKKLTMANLNGLIQEGMLPKEHNFYRALFECNKHMKGLKSGTKFALDDRTYNFITKHVSEAEDFIGYENGSPVISQAQWKKVYDKRMLVLKAWLKDNHDVLLETYNEIICKQTWDKYCEGNISKWEMDSMCFYRHPHELAHVNKRMYGVNDFSELPESPFVERVFTKGQMEIPIYKLSKIIGTVIHKDKTRNSFFLLTQGEVLEIKLSNEHFSLYDKQISEVQDDGSKKVMEKSWFSRGTHLMVLGFRRGDLFIPKKYSKSVESRLSRITEVNDNGTIRFTGLRYGQEEDNG